MNETVSAEYLAQERAAYLQRCAEEDHAIRMAALHLNNLLKEYRGRYRVEVRDEFNREVVVWRSI
jgi:hypothetical protein